MVTGVKQCFFCLLVDGSVHFKILQQGFCVFELISSLPIRQSSQIEIFNNINYFIRIRNCCFCSLSHLLTHVCVSLLFSGIYGENEAYWYPILRCVCCYDAVLQETSWQSRDPGISTMHGQHMDMYLDPVMGKSMFSLLFALALIRNASTGIKKINIPAPCPFICASVSLVIM